MTWALIIIMWGGSGQALTTLPGFTSKIACVEAGEAYLDYPHNSIYGVPKPLRDMGAHYACVPVK